MKTTSKQKKILLVFLCLMYALPVHVWAQDEKQKIINVINTELASYYAKDKATWESTWMHTDKISMTAAYANGFYEVQGWDSLSAQRVKYFSEPVDPNITKIKKEDYDVMIKGSVAIVDLVQKGEDYKGEDFTEKQTVMLQKEGKTWKIFRMINIDSNSYTASDTNIEASINSQGYQYLKLNKVDEAIRVFTLNTQLFPNAWNTWDSLGEAYMVKGENDIATGFYKKSLALNPKNDNGKQMLEKMEKNMAKN